MESFRQIMSKISMSLEESVLIPQPYKIDVRKHVMQGLLQVPYLYPTSPKRNEISKNHSNLY